VGGDYIPIEEMTDDQLRRKLAFLREEQKTAREDSTLESGERASLVMDINSQISDVKDEIAFRDEWGDQ